MRSMFESVFMNVRQGLRHDRTRMTGGAIWDSLAHTKCSVDVTRISSCLIIIFMYKKDVFTKKNVLKITNLNIFVGKFDFG